MGHGAPKGTTARLRAWLHRLAEFINMRGASPEIVTRTIMFFRPPSWAPETVPPQETSQDQNQSMFSHAIVHDTNERVRVNFGVDQEGGDDERQPGPDEIIDP